MSWFTALRVTLTSSNITNLSALAIEIFWPHTRAAWKIHVVFMMELAGLWPLGSKHPSETKEDGGWPDPALQCEITPRSHVFLFILFTLRFRKMEQIARNGAADLLKATSPRPDAVFHLFLAAQLRWRWFLHWQKACLWSRACCCSGTEQACCLLFWIWRIFHGNILC